MNKVVSISIASISTDDLSAYGAVLRFGAHHKEVSACFPLSMYPEAAVLMEGTVAVLKMVTKPCDIYLLTGDAYGLRSNLQNTAFPHLRDELTRLEALHTISWESQPVHEDMAFCRDLAEKSVMSYRKALEIVGDGIDIIRRAVMVFGTEESVRVRVTDWVEKSEEGLDVPAESAEITVMRG